CGASRPGCRGRPEGATTRPVRVCSWLSCRSAAMVNTQPITAIGGVAVPPQVLVLRQRLVRLLVLVPGVRPADVPQVLREYLLQPARLALPCLLRGVLGELQHVAVDGRAE